MTIAVLMTCHNRVETTLACLRRLVPQLGDGGRVFLVDDGSADSTGVKVKAEFPDVNVINGDGTLYWTKGMHLAWEAAIKSGFMFDFFLWLNDDVMLNPDAISNLISDYTQLTTDHQSLTTIHSSMPSPVIVGACSEDDAESACSYGATDAKDVKIAPNGSSPQRAWGWFNGNVVLVSNEVFGKVGMISPDYTHARADYDYAERLKLARVPFYVSSKYVGACPFDFAEKVRGKGLCERLSWLWKPGYFNLHDLYLIRSRYHGYIAAIISCARLIQIVLRGWK